MSKKKTKKVSETTRIYNFIRKAMKNVVKNGGTIVEGQWGVDVCTDNGKIEITSSEGEDNPQVCALGALLFNKNGSIKFNPVQGRRKLDEVDHEGASAMLLGVSPGWVDRFVGAFDGTYLATKGLSTSRRQAQAIGKRLREEFLVSADDDEDMSCGDPDCGTCA
jgi:hypothetical protein